MSIAIKLRKIELVLTKDFSGTDARQIPSDSVVTFYKQGTTYLSGGPVNVGVNNVTLVVRDTGGITVGDTLVLESDIIAGTSSPPTVTVDTVTLGSTSVSPSIRVDHTSGGNMVLSAGNRLIVTNNLPVIYTESSGNITTANPATSNALTGYLAIYTKQPLVDIKIAKAGGTAQVLRDQVAGAEKFVFSADNYTSIQAAINDAPAGSSVYVPAGTYSENLAINKSLTLHGDGRYTIIDPPNGSPAIDVGILADHVSIRDMCILPSTCISYDADGYGIKIDSSSSPNDISQIEITGVVIAGTGNSGIYAHSVNFLSIHNVNCQDTYGSGFYFDTCAQINMSHNYGIRNDDFGAYFHDCLGVQLLGSIGFEQNNEEQGGKTNRDWAEVKFQGCSGVTAHRLNFEYFSHATTKTAMLIDTCNGVSTAGCSFILEPASSAGTRGIYVIAGGSIHIGPNNGYSVETMVGMEEGGAGATPYKIVIDPQTGGTVSQCMVPTDVVDRAGFEIINMNGGIQVPIYATTGRPTATTTIIGTLYYDSTSNKLMICENGGWKTVSTT